MWKAFETWTARGVLVVLAIVFLSTAVALLLSPFGDWRHCVWEHAGHTLGLAELLLVTGTALIAYLAWLKR